MVFNLIGSMFGKVLSRVPTGPMGPMVSAYLDEMAAVAPSGWNLPKTDDLRAGRALLEAAPSVWPRRCARC